jgi:hypothetical protein
VNKCDDPDDEEYSEPPVILHWIRNECDDPDDEEYPEPPFILHWIITEIVEATVFPEIMGDIRDWYVFERVYARLDHAFHYYDPNWTRTAAVSDAGITICGTGIGALLSLRFSIEVAERSLVPTENYYLMFLAFGFGLILFTYTKSRATEHS